MAFEITFEYTCNKCKYVFRGDGQPHPARCPKCGHGWGFSQRPIIKNIDKKKS
jgi:DNA-directed RNA polymerase subunit RPC12/RpoP